MIIPTPKQLQIAKELLECLSWELENFAMSHASAKYQAMTGELERCRIELAEMVSEFDNSELRS